MSNRVLCVGLAVLGSSVWCTAQGVHVEPQRATSTAPRSPAEELASFRLPAGYRAELVAAEPLVIEPACCAFDGDGNLWVAELRTYMQDVDGSGTDEPKGVVARLRDTDGDGRMDERVEFATGLVLPRMLLPLDAKRVLIQNTYDGILWCHHDDDGDGRSDRREEWYRHPRSGANLEHQDSALIWGIDNWLYSAMGGRRHRVGPGGITASEEVEAEFAQWGLATDDLGRQFFSSAGGERPAYGFQQHPRYGKVQVDGSLAPGFEATWPILAIDDVQGGPGRLREDGTLNHFTGCCGQAVFRGDALPADAVGDYFIAEPVGRLIRRAKIDVVGARRVLRNAYERAEFMASTDPNFRPVWLANAPDGALWVVDMYRGIIQEGNWVREGSYLRPVVLRHGLDRNVGRGRIWRIAHERAAATGAARVAMHAAGDAELVAALAHPNGWRRETAQRLLVLRGAQGTVPALKKLVSARENPPLGRVHALWTLEGLGAIDLPTLRRAFRDGDPRVRTTAVRVAESLAPGLSKDRGAELLTALRELAKDDALDVRVQVLQSLRFVPGDAARELALDLLLENGDDALVRAIGNTTLRSGSGEDGTKAGAAWSSLAAEDLARVKQGREIWKTLCIACHGADGRGVEAAGVKLAPSLVGSRRLTGSVDAAARILLVGMSGPIDGVEYAGNLMAPMGQNDDAWIAAVLSFARVSFGNAAAPVSPGQVARVRAACAGRTAPFRVDEIDAFQPVSRDVMKGWRLSASHPGEGCERAIDGDPATRYSTATPMKPGMWFQIDFGSPWMLDRLVLDTRGSAGDYPRGFELRLSDDGTNWSEPLVRGAGENAVLELAIEAPRAARFARIVQTGAHDGLYWSIHELEVHGRPAR